MSKEVFIRVDGSKTLGLGHVFRCMALAYMLQEDFEISFFVRGLPEGLKKKFKEEKFQVFQIQREEDFLKKMKGEEIIVVDHYHLNINFQKKVKENGNILVLIDDIPKGKYIADLLINHAPGIRSQDYNAPISTQFALGLQYVLLRPRFLEAAKDDLPPKKENRLFICFGGSDPKKLTLSVLNFAIKNTKFRNIDVVLGQAYDQVDQIMLLGKSDSRVDVHVSLDEDEIVSLMKKAGVAVVPASGILMEALATGCRVISGMYVQNQSLVYDSFKNNKFFVDAKSFEESDLKVAFEEVDGFSLPQKLIDGQSNKRIQKLFKSLELEQRIILRQATLNDLMVTYSWAANDKLRQHSFTKKQISFREHSEWFSQKIEDLNCLYFIAEENGRAIGSLRYDISRRTALISYLVDPSFQGRGIGTILLKKALPFLQVSTVAVNLIVGYVLPQNIASQKSFQKLGYKEKYQKNQNRYKYSKVL